MNPETDDEKISPGIVKQPAREAPDYNILTSSEVDAFERAAADGKHGRNYTQNEHLSAIQHAIPGASHYVELTLSPGEEMNGVTIEALERLVLMQDADTALMFLYVLHLLAPPTNQPAPEMASGIVDFDDVLEKIGWDPRSTIDRREMHRRIYNFVLFGERAQVIGNRRGAYKDKHTGQLIDTVIRSSPWRIFKDEIPDQRSLFAEVEVPVRVEIVVSREWTQLLTSPQTAQYLPMGEMLGAIPGNKPSGAWARIIGLALASFWRRNPRESMDGTLKPTRRELLERYPPKTGTIMDILGGDKPHRAIEYWCGALQILVGQGFIAATGEATCTPSQLKSRYPRKGWTDQWLNERVSISPGETMHSAIANRSLAIAAAKPVVRKRGRPKKGE